MAKGLLLGAGFSFDLGMPLASEFSDTLFSFLNSFKIENLINNMRGHRPYGNDRTLCDITLNQLLDIYNDFLNSENKNYEELFRIVESLQVTSREAQETISYFLSKLRNIINELFLIYQRKTYFYYILNRDKYKWLIDQFTKEEFWVFTLNHDVLIEMLCIDYKIPLNEGYSQTVQIPMSNLNMEEYIDFGKIDATEKDVDKLNYLKNTKGINILKIHGGLNEFFQGDEKTGRHRMIFDYHQFDSSLNYLNALESFIHTPHYYINDRPPNIESEICISDFDGVLQFMQPSILTGSKKYYKTISQNQREEKIELFSSGLTKIDELYIIGYSFADKHINNRISHAMHLNDKLKVHVVNPTSQKQELFEPFDYDARVRYCNTSFPVWAEYEKTGKWDSEFSKTIHELTDTVRKPLIASVKESIIK